MDMIKLTIDGQKISVPADTTVLTAAKSHGIDIPSLCQHNLVETYGACGICLVEAEGNKKLLRACATKVWEGMTVNTKSPRVIAARKAALELLLNDHRGDCRPPCVEACPANTDCQGYVGLIANGEYEAAAALIKDKLPLPASIGRVCPHPCEEACRRKMVDEPIAIAQLKAFAGDYILKHDLLKAVNTKASTGKTVAIIGAGPAGLTAGYFLARQGHKVEIFEAMDKAGGMLRYGIPQYRLPKEILDQEIDFIKETGITFHFATKVGRDIEFSKLENNFDAVYIAIGAWRSAPLGCPGQDLPGVLGGIDFLRDVAQKKEINIGKSVAVVGGGNTAMDACRTALRLGSEKVYVLYRRTREEMPAEDIEIVEAIEEGVEFKFLVSPLEVIEKNGKAAGIKLQKMRLGEADASGRRRPVPIEGETETLKVDTIIAAIGQKVESNGIPVTLTKWQTIAADKNSFLTDRPGVFAGGDAINDGPGIAISAIGHGNKAATVINSYLQGNIIPYSHPYIVTRTDITPADLAAKPKIPRENLQYRPGTERKNDFEEIALGYSEAEAKAEANRCLECGCADYFECKLIKYGRQYDVQPQRFPGAGRKRQEQDDHPFIERNADKCILCGLCIRVCEEVVGAGVLGLINRGFETIVKPEFGAPLADTDCISCGQCVNLCPTGALMEKWPLAKRVPLAEDKTDSVCGGCGMGCNITVTGKAGLISRILPKDDMDTLCAKGRFHFAAYQKENRLTTAILNGEEISLNKGIKLWQEAMREAIKKYGSQGVGMSISPALCEEDIMAAVKMGKEILQTDNIASLAKIYDASEGNCSYTDLNNAKVIYIGEAEAKDHPVMAMKLRLAKANVTWLTKEEEIDSIREADVIIAVENLLSPQDDANAAKKAKNIGAKLLKLRPMPNSAVLNGGTIKNRDSLNGIKALFLIGDDDSPLPQGIEYLAVMASHKTQKVKDSNLALPLATFLETEGTYINNEGQRKKTAAIVKPAFNLSNQELFDALCH